MTTVNVSISEEMKAFIESQLAREGFASTSEYLHSLIRDAQRRQAKRDLEAKFQEAVESGPATPMTAEDWAVLRRVALADLSAEPFRP